MTAQDVDSLLRLITGISTALAPCVGLVGVFLGVAATVLVARINGQQQHQQWLAQQVAQEQQESRTRLRQIYTGTVKSTYEVARLFSAHSTEPDPGAKTELARELRLKRNELGTLFSELLIEHLARGEVEEVEDLGKVYNAFVNNTGNADALAEFIGHLVASSALDQNLHVTGTQRAIPAGARSEVGRSPVQVVDT